MVEVWVPVTISDVKVTSHDYGFTSPISDVIT